MKEIELKVEGMSCEGCENRIKNALKEIDKVEFVVADHKKKKVRVTLKDNFNFNIIKETIENLGFEVLE